MEESGFDRHANDSFTELNRKTRYMSTDAGRWVDVLVGACGSSLLIASLTVLLCPFPGIFVDLVPRMEVAANTRRRELFLL